MKPQSRMSLGRGVKEGAVLLGGVLFALGAGFLYRKLTEQQVGTGVFTYSLSYTVPVVLCAAAAYMVTVLRIHRIIGYQTASYEEDEIPVPVSEETEPAQEVPDGATYESLEFQEEESIPTAAQQRAEKIASALAAQRVAQADLSLEEESRLDEESVWDAFYQMPDPDEDMAMRELYADLPAELPEGYELPSESEQEQSAEVWDEEEKTEEIRPRSLFWEFLPVLCAFAAFVLVLLLAASFWTKAGEEGIWVARMGKVRAYTWDQVEAYTVDSGFAGGEMILNFQMSDGRKVKITPSSYAKTDAFSDQYENLYQYWLHADNMLAAAGADKTVSEPEYLADAYMSGADDAWYYVRQIIGYAEENPQME